MSHPLGVATGAKPPHPVHPVSGFIQALPAYSLPKMAHIFYWTYKGLAPLSPCSLVEKGSLGSDLAQGTLCIARVLGGELLPAAPLQPCAEAPSGRGMLFYCWTGLTWPQDIMPATMPALQHRHEEPPPCSDLCRGPSSGPLQSVGFIRALPAYSLPNLAHILCSVSFFVSNNIN